MKWTQVIDPFNNIFLSLLVATLPILFLFWALVIKKMKGYQASVLTAALAFLLAILVYRMPVKLALLSIANGVLYGLFPICWIIIPAVFLFILTVNGMEFVGISHLLAS